MAEFPSSAQGTCCQFHSLSVDKSPSADRTPPPPRRTNARPSSGGCLWRDLVQRDGPADARRNDVD